MVPTPAEPWIARRRDPQGLTLLRRSALLEIGVRDLDMESAETLDERLAAAGYLCDTLPEPARLAGIGHRRGRGRGIDRTPAARPTPDRDRVSTTTP